MASITVEMSHSGGTKDFTYNFTCDGGVVDFKKHNTADTWYDIISVNQTTKTVTISANTNDSDAERTALIDGYVDNNLCTGKDAEIKQKGSSDWLTFTFTTTGKVVFNSASSAMPRYSLNGGAWTVLPSAGLTVSSGAKVRLRGPSDHVGLAIDDHVGIGEFADTRGKFTLGGKIATLFYDDYFDRADTDFDSLSYACGNLFYGVTGLTSIADLKLPLVVSEFCYFQMFVGCESLATVPSDLLPAIYLAEGCYSTMFEQCTSLTKAPDLPAKTLKKECYYAMFDGCESLNEIKCLAENISAQYCTSGWLESVAASGDFYCKSSTAWEVDSPDGIPEDWDRHAV